MHLRIVRVRLEAIPLGVKTKLIASRSLGQANDDSIILQLFYLRFVEAIFLLALMRVTSNCFPSPPQDRTPRGTESTERVGSLARATGRQL